MLIKIFTLDQEKEINKCLEKNTPLQNGVSISKDKIIFQLAETEKIGMSAMEQMGTLNNKIMGEQEIVLNSECEIMAMSKTVKNGTHTKQQENQQKLSHAIKENDLRKERIMAKKEIIKQIESGELKI